MIKQTNPTLGVLIDALCDCGSLTFAWYGLTGKMKASFTSAGIERHLVRDMEDFKLAGFWSDILYDWLLHCAASVNKQGTFAIRFEDYEDEE